jgi:GNAT superfamily N-acetyltransferase
MELLDASRYFKAMESLNHVLVNNLFARSVIEKHVTGKVYTDQADHPGSFYIVHPYGMSLLFGETGNDRFNYRLLDYLFNRNQERIKEEWLQAYPEAWNELLASLLGDELVPAGSNQAGNNGKRIELHTRVNFKFNPQQYHRFRQALNPGKYEIVRMDGDLFRRMKGSVVPQFFWDSAEDFLDHGIGFSLVIGGKPVSTAYSAYIIGNQLELGIETIPEYRGKGLALYTCSTLIEFCVNQGYEPVWSCRLENAGSYKLAQKLGFDPTITLPYYKLPL